MHWQCLPRDAQMVAVANSHWNRIVLFDKHAFGKATEVDDPNFQSVAFYERVAKHIEEGCKKIVEKLKGKEICYN